MSTIFHASYWAHNLSLASSTSGMEGLARAIGNARVDLNPHQIDAALFALRSPYSRGVLLADEVGLGKTIEAGLTILQKWAERRRQILLIVPATLRKQWQLELESKFFVPSQILETKSFNEARRRGVTNPFAVNDKVVICSYQFVYSKRAMVRDIGWDIVVVDEAHRLRNIYKENKTAVGIVEAIASARQRILLTATPLQNSLLELYGLISIVDPDLFGSLDSFQSQFVSQEDSNARDGQLKERIRNVCKRTLRRQVTQYINFTTRFTHTADFTPSENEERLYKDVSDYLQRENLVAIPNTQRKLITLVLRKLLASSPAAIGATLQKFVNRLAPEPVLTQVTAVEPGAEASSSDDLADDFDALDELREEWTVEADGVQAAEREAPSATPATALTQATIDEVADLRRFIALAQSIERDSKATKLVETLPTIFTMAQQKGAAKKVVIFTESRKTQDYLLALLNESGYSGQIVMMNGTNTDDGSKRIYNAWKKRNEANWSQVSSGSKSADMKAAIVEEFRDRATIMLATESAAEGVNLQFCSVVVNYDLPWNPQRIEQRIGRCHRYGQKSDVLVVNFLNRRNAADQRVFELLSQKFMLFEGVFGASDDVLGVVESGVDLERAIAAIYQNSRHPSEIQASFDELQATLEESINEGMASARRAFLENFDAEVHDRLRMHKDAAKQNLDIRQQMLLDLAKFSLVGRAQFDPAEPRFAMTEIPIAEPSPTPGAYHLDWQRAEACGDVFFRVDHPLAQQMIAAATTNVGQTASQQITFGYQAHAAALQPYLGASGWLELTKLTTAALGRTEEALLVAACDANGTAIDEAVAIKLFSLAGVVTGPADAPEPLALQVLREQLQHARDIDIDERNEGYFSEEADKIERRSDDLKNGIEQDIKRLDKEISTQKKIFRATRGLLEKVAAQKALHAFEQARTEKRRFEFAEQDRIRLEQDKLIASMEAQLHAKSTKLERIFVVQWRLQPSSDAANQHGANPPALGSEPDHGG